MNYPTHVKIVEVSPRDGLQNEAKFVATANKIDFIRRLSATGLTTIEATSFVSAEKIPQLQDATEVLRAIQTYNTNVNYPVLVPNEQGFDAAIQAGARSIAVFTAASETFTQKNIHASIDESFARFEPVMNRARMQNMSVRGYISCCLGCPYEGDIPTSRVQGIAKRLWDQGCTEISLGDTIGVGTPLKAQAMVQAVLEVVPIQHCAIHFHDTYGQALANILACLQLGIEIIDSAVGGLGGCPYAPGASGNVATEDVVYLLEGMNIHTGIDLTQLAEAGESMCQLLCKRNNSKVAAALLG